MERMSTFNSGLVMAALMVVAAALGLVLLAPALDNVSLPAPREATEADVAQAWESLVDAINCQDDIEAVRLAKWLDERLVAEGKASPTTNSDIIRAWCDLGGHQWTFCEEDEAVKVDGTTGVTYAPIIHHAVSGGGWWLRGWR